MQIADHLRNNLHRMCQLCNYLFLSVLPILKQNIAFVIEQ